MTTTTKSPLNPKGIKQLERMISLRGKGASNAEIAEKLNDNIDALGVGKVFSALSSVGFTIPASARGRAAGTITTASRGNTKTTGTSSSAAAAAKSSRNSSRIQASA